MRDRRSAFISKRRLRFLAAYARPHWRAITLLCATMLADIGLELARPWPLKLVIDNVLGHHATPSFLTSTLPGSSTPHGLLVWAVAGTVAVFLIGAVSKMLYTYQSLRVGQRMVFELSSDLFAHLQRLSLVFHSRRPLGDTIQRLTGDTYCVSTLVTDALVPAVQALVMLGAMFVVMWTLEPTLALAALAVLPFLAMIARGNHATTKAN
jgi:ATP-binding cassette subfamily B protein/subfamily B ATP-binding cassette protein MsbA